MDNGQDAHSSTEPRRALAVSTVRTNKTTQKYKLKIQSEYHYAMDIKTVKEHN